MKARRKRRRTKTKGSSGRRKKARWVTVSGHSRSPRSANGGKPRPKVKKYRRRSGWPR